MSTIETQNFKDLATSKSVDAAYVTDGTAKSLLTCTSAGVISSSLNVSSISDDGTGDVSMSFTSAFEAATYTSQVSCYNPGIGSLRFGSFNVVATGSLDWLTVNASGSDRDPTYHYVSVFGDLA